MVLVCGRGAYSSFLSFLPFLSFLSRGCPRTGRHSPQLIHVTIDTIDTCYSRSVHTTDTSPARVGGDSLVVDALAAAEALRRADLKAFDTLRTVVRFSQPLLAAVARSRCSQPLLAAVSRSRFSQPFRQSLVRGRRPCVCVPW